MMESEGLAPFGRCCRAALGGRTRWFEFIPIIIKKAPKRGFFNNGGGAGISCAALAGLRMLRILRLEPKGSHHDRPYRIIKKAPDGASLIMAEGQGFEPWDGCPSLVFKTSAFDHSATPPITLCASRPCDIMCQALKARYYT